MIKAGDKLTIKFDIIRHNGETYLYKGQKVIVRDVSIWEGHWSRLCPDIWVKEELLGVKLEGEYGTFTPDAFVELSKK